MLSENEKLEGSLDLSDFVNLEKLVCSKNRLSTLRLNGLKNLERISCNDNYLTSFDHSTLNPDKLTHLNISDNNLPAQDLSVFSQFIKLNALWIGGDDKKKFEKGIYNRFCGSLKYLKNLHNLNSLYISNTDINKGVDHLPVNLSRIYFSVRERPESKVGEIARQLNSFLSEKAREVEKKSSQNLTDKEFKKAQEYLDKEYPLSKRKEKTWLDISKSDLEGDLIVENFPRLGRLICSNNQLTSIVLNNLPMLNHFDVSNNKITELTINNCPEISRLHIEDNLLKELSFLDKLDSRKLNFLGLSNNYFPSQDLSIFSRFSNLRELGLRKTNFFGSFRPLINLKKLEGLNVTEAETENDLEYLPDSLKEVAFSHSQNIDKNTENLETSRWGELTKGRGATDVKQYIIPFYDFRNWKEAQPHFKWLKKELEKLNPDLDVNDVLKNIFFNVRTGEFIGNHQAMASLLYINKKITEKIAEEKEKKIQELTDSIKRQWNKAYSAYLYCVANPEERKLLDQLIKSYVEFIKFKNKGFDSSNYRKELKKYKKSYEKYEEELEEKLGEEKMNEIQRILTECEEIANWQLELEEKINERDSIEEKKQFLQITISNNTGNVSIGHIQIGGNATIYQNKEQEFQPKPKPATQEKELNKDYRPAQKELNKEVNSLLRTKKDFVSFRQSTIESLQNCYNEFETSRGKYSKSTEVGNAISSVGGIVGTPVKLIGGGINSGTNFFRGKSHNKFNKDFQEHLLADEEMMTWLDKQYNSSSKYVWDKEREIVSVIAEILKIKKNQTSLFSDEHSVFGISGIWKGRILDLIEMKNIIKLLDDDLKKFKRELLQEEDRLEEQTWFVKEEKEEQTTDSQDEIIQNENNNDTASGQMFQQSQQAQIPHNPYPPKGGKP